MTRTGIDRGPKLFLGMRAFLRVLGLAVLTAEAISAHEEPRVPIADLTQRIAARPDSVPLLLRRAEMRRIEGDWAGARADLAEVARLRPGHAGLPMARAVLALDAGDPAAARALLDDAVRSDPRELRALWLRAQALFALGETRAAITDLGTAIERSPAPHPDLFLERARLQVALGDLDGARAGMEEARARLGVTASLEPFAAGLEQALAGRDVTRSRDTWRVARQSLAAADAAGMVSAREPAGGSDPSLPGESSVPAAIQVTALPRNAVWRYFASAADLGTAWRGPTFNDSSWPDGPGPLGYGDTFINTPIPFGPDAANKFTTTYFRTTFAVNVAPSTLRSMTMNASFDDGFVAYVNGQEVARQAMPTGAITHATLATSHEAGTYEAVDLTAALPHLVQGSNVIAVEVHQSSPSSSDLAWDAEIVFSDDASVTRGPYLQVGTPNAITVRWRTSAPTASWVRFGTSPGSLTSSRSSSALTTEHEVRVTGLTPATRYYYSVGTGSGALAGDATYTFRTAPPVGSTPDVRLWAIGDAGVPDLSALQVRDAYMAWTGSRGTDLWLMLGDNAYYEGTDSEYQAVVFSQMRTMLRQSCLWPTRGNHDLLFSGPNNDYYEFFTMPSAGEAGGLPSGTEAWYSFDWADIHFVCLDSEASSRTPGGAMLTWLANDLAANPRKWVIAFWHHPPYSKGSHDSDTESRLREMRQNALPILEAAGVDVVLSGHSHSYERSFLLDEHYGVSSTLQPSMIVDGGDGNLAGDGPYLKLGLSPIRHGGAVYAVAGSSGRTSGGPLNHPVMVSSLNVPGSFVLDIKGDVLEGRFLSNTGVVRDSFRIVKPGTVDVPPGPGVAGEVQLGPGLPNPFARDLRIGWTLPRAARVRLDILDVTGRRVATLENGRREAGTHESRWDGRDSDGLLLAGGVYLAVLDVDGRRSSRKISFVP